MTESSRYCSNCGAALEVGARFCSSCGQPVTGAAREERASSGAATEPLAAFTNSAMVEATARTTIWVYDDRVRITKVYPVRTQETTLRYSQIAELVNVRPGLIFAELRIETTGGAVLLVKGLPNARAQQAYEVINERL